MKNKLFLYALLLLGFQSVAGQNAVSSLNINICSVQLSPDAKTLSYDVYLQKTNKDTTVAVPGFLFRMAIPQSDIGTSAKNVSITNTTKELGSYSGIISCGTDWMIKFLNGNFVMSYSDALVVSANYPGTLIGTVNVVNADGSSFSDPLTINLNYSGTNIRVKTTCAVFKPNTTTLAANSTAPQPISNFTGLGSYSLSTTSSGGFTIFPNPANLEFQINAGDKTQEMKIFDISGKIVMSQLVNGNAIINISSLPDGIYMVDLNGVRKKLVKK